jgi:hypothetical protein
LFGVSIVIKHPERLWDLVMVGVGGYVVGRSVERGVDLWRRDES